ncbi:2541_t:CDS:1 [Scutellospora calospora]|uniref:2541_t:CDS:1 n=1 Tax=Scutellospora calospora TaxID=85575 RepID=A0ACA9LNJ9_9GLOM|nr:2541_t:CDS:1 [Scutellospora calospora]
MSLSNTENISFSDKPIEEDNNLINETLQTCVICHDEITSLYQLPCNHIFHVNCIEIWLKKDENSKNCSKCKDPYNEDELNTILKHIEESRNLKLKRKLKEIESIKRNFERSLKKTEIKTENKLHDEKKKFRDRKKKLKDDYDTKVKKLEEENEKMNKNLNEEIKTKKLKLSNENEIRLEHINKKYDL